MSRIGTHNPYHRIHSDRLPTRVTNIRITSGVYRGQTIISPHDLAVHPMGSREKLALFNLLQPYLDTETSLLDAYAGTGALGIEALSRGVAYATFIEKNPRVARLIEQNLQKLHLDPSKFDIINASVEQAIELLSNSQYNIIIADPPYNNFSPNSIELLSKLLQKGGILALSHPKNSQKPKISQRPTQRKNGKNLEAPVLSELKLLKTHSYAAAQISFYAKN